MKNRIAGMVGIVGLGWVGGCVGPQETLHAPGAAAPCDWTGAMWIGDGRPLPATDAEFYADDPAPQFRRAFALDGRIRSARLHIAGLGLYEAHLNGTPVAPDTLLPLWTPFGKRVLHDTHDVTPLLKAGTNVLAVTLGNGWWNPLPMRMWGRFNLRDTLAVGRPCLIATLEIDYADGRPARVVSDASWRTAPGPILRNSLYLGEVVDARRATPGWRAAGFDDASWTPAVRVAGPAGALVPRDAPPVSARETWTARSVREVAPAVHVADLGRNFAGWARIRLGPGKPGETVTFRYGELLNSNGTVNGMTAVCGQIKRPGVGGPGAPAIAEQRDVYIRAGGDETYAPRFTWHAFRYVQIEGPARAPAPADVTAVALASAVPDAGTFECSNPLFNDIHRVCRATFLSNLLGVQSDCPARERFGYGADIAVSAEAFLLNFDMHAFYAKTVQDFADEAADGWFTETAPFVGIADRGFGGRSGPVGWTVGVPILLRELVRYHGDRDLVARHYDACARYVDLVAAKCPDFIVPRCIGDHEALEKAPEPLTATAHFHEWARLVAEFATMLGRTDDARRYAALADDIRTAFQRRFVVAGKVGQGRQGEQAFGLHHRLVPDAERAAALDLLKQALAAKGGGPSTGIYGTRYLFEILAAEGLDDLAGAMVNRRGFPGWGFMLDRDATTLWENWKGSDNTYSQNHPMFGSVDEWFYKHVLGLAPAPDAVGFDKIVIRPNAVGGVTWARGSYRTARGPVRVDWRLEGARMRLAVEIPPGSTARVWLADRKAWVTAAPGRHSW
jgi:alpha-L-rhamnosidase